MSARQLLCPPAVAAILAGCGSASHSPAAIPNRLPPAHTTKRLSAPQASVRILTPGARRLVARRFRVTVAIAHFTLQTPRAGRTPLQGHGLLEFSLDSGRYDEPRYSGINGRWALALAVNGYYSPAYQPQITYQGIPPGLHTLTVRLANRDNSPTGVAATARFRVR